MKDEAIEHRSSRADNRFLHFRRDGSLLPQHGLDGLRGLAVAAVVVFHADLGVVSGGYLGVSLFFTLSGFLITSLALAEISAHGTFQLRAFWGRRFRRLLPAAWLTVGIVLLATIAAGSMTTGLKGDVWAALANVANWRFLAAGQSYASLFSGESPLLHFWSLAIEEQFYLAFPLLIWGVVKISRQPARLLGVAVGSIAVASFLLPVTLVSGLDRVYYGTDTRAGEIAVGSLFAVILAVPSCRVALLKERTRSLVGAVSLAVFGAVLAAWFVVTRTWSGLENGGLGLVALSSVVLILGALVPGSPVYRIATVWPLRTLGRISYAVYLFHWPALTFLTEERTGLQGTTRVVVVIAGVVAAALLSERLVERPFRRGGVPLRAASSLAVAALATLVAVPIVVPVNSRVETLASLDDEAQAYRDALAGAGESASAEGRSGDVGADNAVDTEPPPQTEVLGEAETAPPRPDVAMFGDSILLTLALASGFYNSDFQYMGPGEGVLELGCGVARGGIRRSDADILTQEKCDAWPTTWAAAVTENDPDVAVVMSCQWENIDRRYEGGEWLHVGQPSFDDIVRAEYGKAADLLHDSGVDLVLWVRCPYFSQTVGTKDLPESLTVGRDPERVDALNAIIDQVIAERPGFARPVDLAGWVNQRTDDATVRPDGSHFERSVDTGAGEVFTRLIVDAYDAWWRDHPEER